MRHLQALISRANPVTSISDGNHYERKIRKRSYGNKMQSRWDTEPGAYGVAVDGGVGADSTPLRAFIQS
jgi:hypothetical protein